MDVFEAIKKKDAVKLKDLLTQGANPNAVRSDGLSLVHLAAQSGSAPCMDALTSQVLSSDISSINQRKYTIKVDVADPDGNTPLHLAAKAGDVEMVKAILSTGANPNLINKLGKKPLDVAKDGDVKAMLAGTLITCFTVRYLRVCV